MVKMEKKRMWRGNTSEEEDCARKRKSTPKYLDRVFAFPFTFSLSRICLVLLVMEELVAYFKISCFIGSKFDFSKQTTVLWYFRDQSDMAGTSSPITVKEVLAVSSLSS